MISYGSTLSTRGRAAGFTQSIPPTARPTFSRESDFNFTWGFRRNFALTILVPVRTNNFGAKLGNGIAARGTGLGDAMVLVKYRFYRRDSERGTTQASLVLGPKVPTGRTDLADTSGRRLPASLQPGSGSTDFWIGANWTYTGLFHFKRLVADESFQSLLRSRGTQATRLGNSFQSRFWLSYRPYQSRDVAREWFFGPQLTWLHSQDDHISGVTIKGNGGDVLLAGLATFLGVRPGLHIWLGMDWDVAHSSGARFTPLRRQFTFGITQQFRMHF